MKPARYGKSFLACGLLAMALWSGTGCLGPFVHPLPKPAPAMVQPCQVLPPACRDHVYIVFINGMDPVDACNLRGLRDYVHQLGFRKTYFCQVYHVFWLKKELLHLVQEEPLARIVLVGYGLGAGEAAHLARALCKETIPVDLLIYLGGSTLKNNPDYRPANVRRVINIQGAESPWPSWCWLGSREDIDGAENLLVEEMSGDALASSWPTLELLARELLETAAFVPIRLDKPLQPHEIVPEPTPRLVLPQTVRRPDAWDFLKPSGGPEFGQILPTAAPKKSLPPSRVEETSRPSYLPVSQPKVMMKAEP